MSKVALPPFAALRAFCAVAECGGIRRGAARLGVSHAIVSRHLRTIEAHFGQELMNRQSGQLTETGKTYHRRIAAAFSAIEAASAVVMDQSDPRLTISCSAGLASLWLVDRLRRFGGPGQPVIDLQSSDSPPDFSLRDTPADIRYIFHEDERPGASPAVSVELARPPIVPVASPAFIAAIGGEVAGPHALADLPLIEEQSGLEWQLWLSAHGLAAPTRAVARYGQAHLALGAARAGQGIALGNHFLISDDVARGRLGVVPTAQPFRSICLGTYRFRCNRHRWADPRVRSFYRWLATEVKEEAQLIAAQPERA